MVLEVLSTATISRHTACALAIFARFPCSRISAAADVEPGEAASLGRIAASRCGIVFVEGAIGSSSWVYRVNVFIIFRVDLEFYKPR